MEDNLSFFQREDDINVFQMKGHPNIFQIEDNLNLIQIKDHLHILANVRQPLQKIMQPKTIKIKTRKLPLVFTERSGHYEMGFHKVA